MIIIICPRCSTNNPIGSNVCGGCGTPLGDYTLSPNYMPNHRTNKQNSNSALIAVIISLFLVFMILIGVLMYILLRPDDNSNDQNITPNPNTTNVATITGSTTGRMLTNIDLDDDDQQDIDNTPITPVVVNIPQPISEPFSIPYSNPQNARQRFLNSAAEIKNYEYYNLSSASNQTDRNLHARVAFEKWDVLLNEVYAYLKNNMSKSEFKTLDNDELNWIKRKESAISSAAKQYKGTSKETEARYMTGISYTRERCAYLISLIPSQQTPPPPPPTPDVKQKYLNEASAIESYENNIYNATNQTDINLHARIAFEKWDVLLNEVYAHLRGQMSQSEFKALDNDELSWIKQKEAAISSAVAPHSGTDKEPEARYKTGISYTKDRCYYLISLVR